MKVLMKEGYEAGAIDFKPLLVKVKSKKPDLVLAAHAPSQRAQF